MKVIEFHVLVKPIRTNFGSTLKKNKSTLGTYCRNGSDLNLDDFATYFEGLSNGTDLNFVPQDDLP